MALTPSGFLVKSPSCDEAPKYGLLHAVTPQTISDPHWQASGVEWEDFLCGQELETFLDVCPPTTGFTKAADRTTQFCGAEPFVVVGSYDCPPVGRPSNEAFEIARKRLLTWESHQVEQTLWTGIAGSGAGVATVNPSFAYGNESCDIVPVDINEAGNLDPVAAIAALEGALGDVVACGGTIHVPYQLVAHLARFNLLVLEDGGYYTPTGVKVVAGHGYPGTGPANVAAAADEAWAFATGPVLVVQGGILMTPNQIQEAVDRSINNVTVRAEKFFAVGFSCALFAVRVSTGCSC